MTSEVTSGLVSYRTMLAIVSDVAATANASLT
jgi:hypothetical protein